MDRIPGVTVGIGRGAADGRGASLIVFWRPVLSHPEVWNVGIKVGGHVVMRRGGGQRGEGRRIQCVHLTLCQDSQIKRFPKS